MYRTSQKFMSLIVIVAFSALFVFGEAYAADPTVKLVINPNKTDVDVGADPVAITAQATGANLTYRWELVGPGKIEGSGSAVFYIVPDKIDRETAQAIVTVIITDGTGQETTQSITFNIVSKQLPPVAPVPPPKPKSTGMSTTTKVILGLGAAAAIGVGIAVLAGGGDEKDKGPFTGRFSRSYVTFTNRGTALNATDMLILKQDGNSLSGSREMVRSWPACCTLTFSVSASGTVNGTAATISFPAGQGRCDGAGGCWLTSTFDGGTFNYTLINNNILRSGTSDFVKQSVIAGYVTGENEESVLTPVEGDFFRQ